MGSVSFGFDTDFTCRGIVANSLMPSTAAPFTTAAPVAQTTAMGGTTATPIPAWQCCGAYPNRFPYKTNNGARGCCSGATYATALLECCPNGSTAVIGTCYMFKCSMLNVNIILFFAFRRALKLLFIISRIN